MTEAKAKATPGFSSWTATLAVIALWYAANISTIISNRWLLSSGPGFRQPVFLTLCHMSACVVMGFVASHIHPSLALKPVRSKQQFYKVCFLAVIFCATIVLGNASLKYLHVSFNQAIGSTTPFYTAVFSYLLQGVRENYLTYASLVPIMGGIAIASGGEIDFHLLGFLLCMAATAGRALKTVIQSILMTDPSEKLDPMSLLFYMSAVSVVLLTGMTVVLEPNALTQAAKLYAADSSFATYMVINAALAYFTNLLNFVVTKYTSALTLQVLGNAKGVVAAVVSVRVFGNTVTTQGILGYAITVAGVFAYSEAKRRGKAEPTRSPSVHGLMSAGEPQASPQVLIGR
mmetsp:Transcript_26790/g.68228  ORF Transcript_26790/g.68228 Transcript_26790/m.68228 type:complete len:345 (+) Transcript_26790:130-1164(+)